MKSIYKGFWQHKRAHIRSGWTIIDIAVIISGLVELFVNPRTSMQIRILRIVLRPLKMINAFQSMRTLIRSLIKALPDFNNVGVFLVFIFILFGTMGIQQYSSQLFNSCRFDPIPNEQTFSWMTDLSIGRPCSTSDLGIYDCPRNLTCGNLESYLEVSIATEHYEKRAYMNYGITTFSHLGTSLLTIFQMITSETWMQQMFNMMDVDIPIIGALFCFSIIIVGQIFLLNLILAVIIQAFMTSQQQEVKAHIQQLEIGGIEEIVTSSSEDESSSSQSDSLQSQINEVDEEDSEVEEVRAEDSDKGLNLGQSDESGFFQLQIHNQNDQRRRRTVGNKEHQSDSKKISGDLQNESQDQMVIKDMRSEEHQRDLSFNNSLKEKISKGKIQQSDESSGQMGGNGEGFKQYAFKSMHNGQKAKEEQSMGPAFQKSKTTLSKLRKMREKATTKNVVVHKSVIRAANQSQKEKSVGAPSVRTKKVKVLKNMGDLILQDAKLEEQERRYNDDQGFLEFLRKQATTRKIANIFTQMRENRVKRLQVTKRQSQLAQAQSQRRESQIANLYMNGAPQGSSNILLFPGLGTPTNNMPPLGPSKTIRNRQSSSNSRFAKLGQDAIIDEKNQAQEQDDARSPSPQFKDIRRRTTPSQRPSGGSREPHKTDSKPLIDSNAMESHSGQALQLADNADVSRSKLIINRRISNNQDDTRVISNPLLQRGETSVLQSLASSNIRGVLRGTYEPNVPSMRVQKNKYFSGLGLNAINENKSNLESASKYTGGGAPSGDFKSFRTFKTGRTFNPAFGNRNNPAFKSAKSQVESNLSRKSRVSVRQLFRRSNQFQTCPIDVKEIMLVKKMKQRIRQNFEQAEMETFLQKTQKKTNPPKNIQSEKLAELLEKKFILEAKKNMLNRLVIVAVQKNIISKRRQNKVVNLFFNIQGNPVYQFVMQLFVLGNILNLGYDHYPIDYERLRQSEKWNILFTCAYVSEVIIKVAGLGVGGYFGQTRFHYFEVVISLLSIIDVAVTGLFIEEDQLFNSILITVFRSLRTIRLFKLARYWRGFRIILETIWKTVTTIYPFLCLLGIVLYSYTLTGMQLFSNKSKINQETQVVDPIFGTSPQFNFDTFIDSFLTVFIILTNDNQSKIYYDYFRSTDPVAATIFWMTYIIFAQKILLNVFIAIILQQYNELTVKNNIDRIEEKSFDKNANLLRRLKHFFVYLWKKYVKKETVVEDEEKEGDGVEDPSSAHNFQEKEQSPKQDNEQQGSKHDIKEGQEQEGSVSILRKAATLIKDDHHNKALGFIPHDNQLRQFLDYIIHHRRYENFIVCIILITAVQLALESALLDPNSTLKAILYWINITTLSIFSVEFVAKIIVYGFCFNGHESYLRNVWNIIDFTILIQSFLYVSYVSTSFKIIKTLKFMKALRLISRNQGLQVAVRALLFAIPNVAQFTIIMALFFFIFAEILVSYFKGKLMHCEALSSVYLPFIIDKWTCLDYGGIWMNRTYNFDNIANAIVSLFVMSTTNGWSEIMSYTIASNNIDEEPFSPKDSSSRNPVWILFFITFQIIGGFFFLNLFVGVVLNTFYKQSQKLGGGELLTDKQKVYIETRLLVLKSAPIVKFKPSQNFIRKICYHICENHHFERVIQICILANTIALMLEWYRINQGVHQVTEILNQIFTIIFTVEALVRILAIGVKGYFKDGWNIFDFLIAMGSVIGNLVSMSTSVRIKGTSTLRAFRILRLLRLLKRGGQSLALIFNTLVITLQTLSNIGALLILFTYMYSLVGMMYFGEVKRTGNMNDYINFEGFYSAFITMFTVATGDSWNLTMESFAKSASPQYDCIADPDYYQYQANGFRTIGCGNKAMAFAFFVSFNFIVRLIFLKLFIAVILEGYLKTQVQDTRLFNNEQREKFRQIWSEYDPEATTFISLKDLRTFLFSLGAPLGFDETFNGSKFLQDKFISSLELPTYKQFRCYQFLDVLDALSFRLMVMDHMNKIEEELAKKRLEHLAELGDAGGAADDAMTSGEHRVRDIELEVNRLIYQKQSENIIAFRELWEKEQINQRSRDYMRDENGLTSSHHMALEALIRRVKARWANRDRAAQLLRERVAQSFGMLQSPQVTSKLLGAESREYLGDNTPQFSRFQ